MKIYYLNYATQECGEIQAFSSKRAAEKRLKEMEKEQKDWIADYERRSEAGEDVMYESRPYDQLPWKVWESEFEISKAGIIEAFEAGAAVVIK